MDGSGSSRDQTPDDTMNIWTFPPFGKSTTLSSSFLVYKSISAQEKQSLIEHDKRITSTPGEIESQIEFT